MNDSTLQVHQALLGYVALNSYNPLPHILHPHHFSPLFHHHSVLITAPFVVTNFIPHCHLFSPPSLLIAIFSCCHLLLPSLLVAVSFHCCLFLLLSLLVAVSSCCYLFLLLSLLVSISSCCCLFSLPLPLLSPLLVLTLGLFIIALSLATLAVPYCQLTSIAYHCRSLPSSHCCLLVANCHPLLLPLLVDSFKFGVLHICLFLLSVLVALGVSFC